MSGDLVGARWRTFLCRIPYRVSVALSPGELEWWYLQDELILIDTTSHAFLDNNGRPMAFVGVQGVTFGPNKSDSFWLPYIDTYLYEVSFNLNLRYPTGASWRETIGTF